MGSDTGNNVGIHIQNAALCALLFLKTLQDSPQLVGSLGRASQEGLISLVRLVVMLDKITGVYFFFPQAAVKSIPLIKVSHLVFSSLNCAVFLHTVYIADRKKYNFSNILLSD